MTFVVELADDQLSIEPIHRLVHLAAGDAGLRQRLAESFTITAAGPNTPEGVERLERSMHEDGGMGLVDSDGLALLVADLGAFGGRGRRPGRAYRCGAVRDRRGPAALRRVDRVPPRRARRRGARRQGVADAALLLRPVSVADTRAAALAGVRMPQKTTFFAPKPRTGMVFRTLD